LILPAAGVMDSARLAANRIADAWLLAKLRSHAKIQFEQVRANNGAVIVQSSYRQHVSRRLLLQQRRMHAKALRDFSILARDLGDSASSHTSSRRLLAEKLMHVLISSRIESAAFRCHRGVAELKRTTGLGTLSSMLQLLCELGHVHAPVAGSSMSDEGRATCARCIAIVVCVMSFSFDSSFPSTLPSSPAALSPSRRARHEAQSVCFSHSVVGGVVCALSALLHSAPHSNIVCARGVVSALHQILGCPSAAACFCTIDCCSLLLQCADNCSDSLSCASAAASLRALIASAQPRVHDFAAQALSRDRLAALFLAATCAPSQAAVIDLSIDLLNITSAPFQNSSVQACIVSAVHPRLASDSVRLKFARLCMRVMPLLH